MNRVPSDSSTPDADRHPSARTTVVTTPNPVVLFALTALAIFVAEVAIMLVLPFLTFIPAAAVPIADGLLMTTLAAPFLYVLLFRPLVRTVGEYHRAAGSLKALNAELEERVRERTSDLDATVTALEREVQERGVVEERLRKANRFTRQLVESSPCMMSVVDVGELRCSYVNARIGDLLGYSPEEATIAEPSFLDLIVARSDLGSTIDLVRRAAAGPDPGALCATCTLRTREGTTKRFRLGVTPLSRPDGSVVREVLLTALPAADDA